MIPGFAATAATLALMGVGYTLWGSFGALVGAMVMAAASLLALRAGTVQPPVVEPSPGEPDAGGPSGRIPRLERIRGMVTWAPVAGRHFEHGARRLVRELLAGRLAERHRIDLDTDPVAARAVVGDRLWPLVDPAVSYRADESGVDLRTLDELVTMLEGI